MIEIYDECKSAIINNKCSECNEFYSCYICDFVEERYQQGRADAIEECIKVIDEVNWLESDTYIGLLKKLKEK